MRLAPRPQFFSSLFLAFFPGLLLAQSTDAPAELGRPLLEAFSPRDYQADPLCQAIVQDADGLLIVANNTDALAFDGTSWQPVALPPASTGIVQLVLAADGFVYAAGGNVLGFFRGPIGHREYVSLLDRLPAPPDAEPREYRIAAASDALYCADDEHLWAWRDGRFTAIAGASLPPEVRLFSAGGHVYVAGDDAPLRQIDGDHLTLYADDPLLRRNRITHLAADPGSRGLLALTREHGFLRVSPQTVARRAVPADRWLEGKRVRTAQLDSDGSWVLAFAPDSGNGGLRLTADGHVLGPVDESIGLPGRALRAFATDREGGLWIGLESGLARIAQPAAVSLFDDLNGLRGFVTTVERHEGTLYAATIDGLFRLVPRDPGRPVAAAHFERVLSGPVYGLLSDRDGLLVRAQHELLRVRGAAVDYLLPLPAAIGGIVHSSRDPDRLWLNTMQGMLALHRTGVGWGDEGLVPGLVGHVAGFVENRDGSLWVASFDRGFFRLTFPDPDHPTAALPAIESFPRGTAGLPADFDHCAVYEWAGAPVFYLDRAPQPYRFDAARKRFVPLPGTEALAARGRFDCWSSSPTGGDLWFTNNDPRPARHAIYRLPANGGAPQALPHAIAEAAGKIWRLLVEPRPRSPVLWICSAGGLLRVELAGAFPPPPPLVTVLHAVGVADRARLPAVDTALAFAFSAPRYAAGSSVQFQTRLLGLDRGWTPWSVERSRAYGHLPAGDYRFEVRARDADGALSAPVGLAFSLWPPWWRSWWALTLAAAAGIVAIAAASRWIAVRALRRRFALLEAQSAVERERLRLARDLHDDIGSGLGRVILFAGEAERAAPDPVRLAAALGRIRTSAQELVQHAREIVWAVSPQHDTVASLAERVADHVAETLTAAGVACTVDLPPDLPSLPLGSEARHSLFLAVKEAVHNCVKYAAASAATFRVAMQDRTLTLTLADNGRGFAPGERRGSGHGLRHLAARAEALGGSAEIASEPNRGTTVMLRVPLPRGAIPTPCSRP